MTDAAWSSKPWLLMQEISLDLYSKAYQGRDKMSLNTALRIITVMGDLDVSQWCSGARQCRILDDRSMSHVFNVDGIPQQTVSPCDCDH
mmetsp:Transcript_18668/g.42715  ORF Transcript_18668/g.42715 Transcript_18668/m.42715 type:complete len:89 (-) Transcript_18668:13-279(-)